MFTAALAPQTQKLRPKEKNTMEYDFSPFSVDISQFPFATWRRISNQCMNDLNQELFLLGDSQGDFSLRQAISTYLHSSRGALVEPEQIVIGAGTDYLLQLLVQILGSHRTIAMENPAYVRAYQIFQGLGCSIISIPVTKDGMNLERLEQSEADICYVTPTHQYPLGVVMPIMRRMQLLKWALKNEERYIIEDDHDSEFRYRGKPIPCLQGIDQSHRVIYIGTFSRAVAPAIRMGYMVLPKPLLNLYHQKLSYYASTVSRIDQAIICEFINGGFFERHVNKMRKKYKLKHDTMLRALKVFEHQISISGEYAGLHMVVEFHIPCTEEELIAQAAKCGVKLYGLSRYYIGERNVSGPTILMGFANLSKEKIVQGINKIYEELCRNKYIIQEN